MKSLDIFNELSEHISVRINSCRSEYHAAQYQENKTHQDYDVWLIQDGTMTITIQTQVYRVCTGDVVLFCPGLTYVAAMGPSGCRFTYIHFDFGIGNNYRLLEDFNLSGIHRSPLIDGCRLQLLDRLDPGALKHPLNALRIKGAFISLLAEIIAGNAARPVGAFFQTEGGRPRNSGRLQILQPVFRYIDDHLTQGIHMGELAAVARMSEKYFITYFKGALGISPGQYINQLKMNQAREYLYQRQYSIKEIASRLGYPNQYTFSRSFRKYFGVPPSRFD